MERGKHTEYEMKLRDTIARNLKKLLIEKRMTQKQLSETTGIPTSTISDYLNSKSLALPGNVQKIAFALKVSKAAIDPSFGESTVTPLEHPAPKIPLIGTICAGDGLLAEQNIEGYVYYPFPSKVQPDYALRVKGDSMSCVGINDGDIVYLREAKWADFNGQIVAALINDEEDGTLKRMKWSEGSPVIRLIPENENYKPIEVLPSDVKVCGVYIGHFTISGSLGGDNHGSSRN
jgi:repressor LexA